MVKKKYLSVPSDKKIGLIITAETFQRGYYFDFPKFKKGNEYPKIFKIEQGSIAYKEGLNIGDTLLELNGFSFYKKDLSTIMCDFDYERRSSKFLTLTYC